METEILQGVSRRVAFKAFLSSDHISPATGKTIDVEINKNMTGFADPDAGPTTATEDEGGWYYVDLDGAADIDTLGPLIVRGSEGTIDPAEVKYFVVGTPMVDANVVQLDGSADAAERLKHGALALGFGTIDTGASTTTLPIKTLSLTVGVADQLKNRVLVFKPETATANLAGFPTRITGVLTGPLRFTVSPACPATPAEDDEFSLE